MRTAKVRVLNFFRNVFRIRFLESNLALLTQGKAADHLLCKLVPNPYQYAPGAFRILKRNGIVVQLDISDYIGHLVYFGFKEPGIDKLFSLCKENSVVVDVGTNIGWTVLRLTKIAHRGKVFGFEPDPYNFERCMSNVRLNSFKNVQVFPMGLGDKNDTLNMEVRTLSNRGGNRIAPSGTTTTKVSVVRLDDFKPAQELSKIDLIKIDVEGYELNVLRGAEQLLRKHKPVLFIELDDDNLKDQGDSARALVDFLYNIGYQKIEHGENGSSVTSSSDFHHCHFDIIAK